MRRGRRAAAAATATTTSCYRRRERPTGGAPAAATSSFRGSHGGSRAGAGPLAPANAVDSSAVLVYASSASTRNRQTGNGETETRAHEDDNPFAGRRNPDHEYIVIPTRIRWSVPRTPRAGLGQQSGHPHPRRRASSTGLYVVEPLCAAHHPRCDSRRDGVVVETLQPSRSGTSKKTRTYPGLTSRRSEHRIRDTPTAAFVRGRCAYGGSGSS